MKYQPVYKCPLCGRLLSRSQPQEVPTEMLPAPAARGEPVHAQQCSDAHSLQMPGRERRSGAVRRFQVRQMRVQGFLIYRIWYGNCLVYVGRTKQPLQSRIRGHLFSKPMHRTVNIEQVTKIEYAELGSEADMNLYEIYYILRLHPPLNVDDKARDDLSVTLPELEWKEFTTPLWEGWRQEIAKQDSRIDYLRKRYAEIPQEISILRGLRKTGEITEYEFEERLSALKEELAEVSKELWHR